jgi:hypothetical protein
MTDTFSQVEIDAMSKRLERLLDRLNWPTKSRLTYFINEGILHPKAHCRPDANLHRQIVSSLRNYGNKTHFELLKFLNIPALDKKRLRTQPQKYLQSIVKKLASILIKLETINPNKPRTLLSNAKALKELSTRLIKMANIIEVWNSGGDNASRAKLARQLRKRLSKN